MAPTQTMNHRNFPLNGRVSMSPEDTDGFIDLEQLLAAARRQVKVVALCAALGLATGHRLSRLHAAGLHGLDATSCSTTA